MYRLFVQIVLARILTCSEPLDKTKTSNPMWKNCVGGREARVRGGTGMLELGEGSAGSISALSGAWIWAVRPHPWRPGAGDWAQLCVHRADRRHALEYALVFGQAG
jgi:hypothetical protein